MGRERRPPDVRTSLGLLHRRLARLERPHVGVLTPAATSAAVSVTATTPTVTHVALVNPVGSRITWWVQVTLSSAPSITVQLSEPNGAAVVMTAQPGGLLMISLTVPDGWITGEQRLVSLSCSVPSGTASVLPVKALVG